MLAVLLTWGLPWYGWSAAQCYSIEGNRFLPSPRGYWLWTAFWCRMGFSTHFSFCLFGFLASASVNLVHTATMCVSMCNCVFEARNSYVLKKSFTTNCLSQSFHPLSLRSLSLDRWGMIYIFHLGLSPPNPITLWISPSC